jgi:hypothetical protein
MIECLGLFCIISFYINMGFLVYTATESFRPSKIFNPITNYKKWKQFNWFGIIIITLMLNIILFPNAIIYWIYILFTIGRKDE